MPKYVVIRNTQKIENSQEIIADSSYDAVIQAGYCEDKLSHGDHRPIGSGWGSPRAKISAENASMCVVEYTCDHDKLAGNYFEVLNNIDYGAHTFMFKK